MLESDIMDLDPLGSIRSAEEISVSAATYPIRIRGSLPLVVVNPYYKALANFSAKEYKDTSLPMVDTPKPLQAHLYELAARMYLTMRRRNENQALLSRGITGSGNLLSMRLVVNQILRLASHSFKKVAVSASNPWTDVFDDHSFSAKMAIINDRGLGGAMAVDLDTSDAALTQKLLSYYKAFPADDKWPSDTDATINCPFTSNKPTNTTRHCNSDSTWVPFRTSTALPSCSSHWQWQRNSASVKPLCSLPTTFYRNYYISPSLCFRNYL
ncbi:hypothetical protein BDZ89DRAFT_1138104 [Hymenopellis radicata]|nr:hypothetical protein BDZ89DRAFT_1138104 [Hymenopellis radicata]